MDQSQVNELIESLRGAVPALQSVKTEGSSLGEQFKNLVSGMSASGSSIQDMGLQAAKLVPGLGEVVQAAQVAAATVQQFTDTVKKYVSAYSPADVAMFDMAMKDLTAVIGYELQPAMQGMTTIVREIANSLFADGASVRSSIKEATDAVVNAFKENKATIDLVTTTFSAMIKQAAGVVEVFGTLAKFSGILSVLGFGKEGRDAFGLGAGPGQVTDPASAFKTAQTSALAAGGAAETPEDKRHKELMEQFKILNGIVPGLGAAAKWILEHLAGGITDAKELEQAALRMGRSIRQAMTGGLGR